MTLHDTTVFHERQKAKTTAELQASLNREMHFQDVASSVHRLVLLMADEGWSLTVDERHQLAEIEQQVDRLREIDAAQREVAA